MKALAISDKNKWARFVTLEAKYSLLCRELENELIPACLDQNVGIVAFSPLHGGFLGGRYKRNTPWPVGTRFTSPTDTGRWTVDIEKLYDIVDVLHDIAKKRKASVSGVALNYLLQKKSVCSLIIGVHNIQQFKDNLSAIGWRLTDDEMGRLNNISEPLGLYPYTDQKIKLGTKV